MATKPKGALLFWGGLLVGELAFLLALVLILLFTVIMFVIGILNVFTLPFRERVAQAFAEPFKHIGALWKRVAAHLRYLYRAEFLPRHRQKMAAQRERQRQRSEQAAARKRERAERRDARERRRERQRDWSWSYEGSDYDSVDGLMLLSLTIQLSPLLIFVPHLIVSTIGLLSVLGFMAYYRSAPEPQSESIPEVVIEYEPQIADKQEADYGPWYNRGQVIDVVDQPDFRNIALLSDTGSLQYSQNLVGLQDGFKPITTEKVRSVQRKDDGRIAFRDQHGNAFTLNPGQAFLFENYKTSVFMFDPKGRTLAIETEKFQPKEIKK